MSFCHLLIIFSKLNLKNNSLSANSLDPDQDQHSIGLELGPKCLQRLSTDDKGCNTLSHSGFTNLNTWKRMFYPLITQ